MSTEQVVGLGTVGRTAPVPHAGLPPAHEPAHIGALDGLRAMSILLVLAAHLLPLGPKDWGANEAVGVAGMGLFFALSGFLVTTQLLENTDLRRFLLRRGARILPLAWAYMALALTVDGADARTWLAQFVFVANQLDPQALTPSTAHLWSLCVEVQFYGLAALTVGLAGRRALPWLAVLGLAFTAWRVHQGVYAASRTELRADEILAGCSVALLWHGRMRDAVRAACAKLPIGLLALAYGVSCWAEWPGPAYLRPYWGALLLAACLAQPATAAVRWLSGARLAYLATISYALYVWHPLLAHSWLGSGDTAERYLKRPLLFVALLLLAHASTFHYERVWTDLARRVTRSKTAP